MAGGVVAGAVLATQHIGPPGSGPALAALGLAASAWALAGGNRELCIRLATASLAMLAIVGRCAMDPAPSAAAPLPGGDGPWTATVVARSAPREGNQRFVAELEQPPIRVDVTAARYPEVVPGDMVALSGGIEAPPESPYGTWLVKSGLAGTLRAKDVRHLETTWDAARLVAGLRDAAGEALERSLPEPEAGLGAGILVGLRERVDRGLAADFTATGLSHVVAISGWNIALVAGLAATLLSRAARRRRAAMVVLAVGAYAIFAGASPSVLRAAVMAGVALSARELGRPGSAARALGWAVTILVVVAPASVADAGFQLSAAATAGLLAWATPLSAAATRRWPWVPGFIVEGLAVSLAAQAATLPIALAAFGRLALLSPVLNLVVVPLVPPAMAAGALALGGGFLALLGAPAAVATFAGLPAAMVLGLMVAIVHAAAGLPVASVTVPPDVALVLAATSAILIAALAARRSLARLASAMAGRAATRSDPTTAPWLTSARAVARPAAHPTRPASWHSRPIVRLAIAALGLAGAAMVLAGATRSDGRVHVVVLDVGQGDAILVRTPHDARMLVDAGPDPERLLASLDERLPPWDRRLDLVVVTHPHDDHVGGLAALLERYRVGRIIDNGMTGGGPADRAFREVLAERRLIPAHLYAGDEFALDGVSFTVLWPQSGTVPASAPADGSATNNASIVLLGEVGGERFLLTGDMEQDVDAALVARGLPAVDLLKVAHHGSRTATTDALLDAARPRVALISVGVRNDYGHPANATLDRLVAHGAQVFRTDLGGSLDVAFDGAGLHVAPEHPRPAGSPTVSPDPIHSKPGSVPGSMADRVAGVTEPHARPARRRRPGRPPRLPYDRGHDRPGPRGGRRTAPLARSTALAPAPLARRRGGRGVAGRTCGPARRRARPPPGGGSGPAARRRQGPGGGRPGAGASSRRGLGCLAGGTRVRGAWSCRRGPPGDAAGRRPSNGGLAGRRDAGGAARGVRGQAGRPAPRKPRRAVRRLAPALPADPRPRDGADRGRRWAGWRRRRRRPSRRAG